MSGYMSASSVHSLLSIAANLAVSRSASEESCLEIQEVSLACPLFSSECQASDRVTVPNTDLLLQTTNGGLAGITHPVSDASFGLSSPRPQGRSQCPTTRSQPSPTADPSPSIVGPFALLPFYAPRPSP